jgi:hypothetical protein
MGTVHTHAMTPIDESNLYREWCVPAALINALASVTLMTDDDVDELAGERWVERPCFARPLEGARDYPPPHRAQVSIRNRLGHKDSRERWVPGSHEVLWPLDWVAARAVRSGDTSVMAGYKSWEPLQQLWWDKGDRRSR